MADVIVVGDGPGGLSAALFLAKNGLEVVVFGTDQTAMHAAMLNNYLGVPAVSGTDLQAVARDQVRHVGGQLIEAEVASVRATGEGFVVQTTGDEGLEYDARFLVLSEGRSPKLAQTLGLQGGRGGVPVDRNGRTEVDGVYAVGRMVRPGRSQAIISAGDGAAAALDILARIKGVEAFVDWERPES